MLRVDQRLIIFKKMKTLLWLDDYRNPMEGQWLTFSPITTENLNVVWVKNYNEFENWIYNNGLPDAICFDHDLSDFQAFYNGYPEKLEQALKDAEEVGRLDKWKETMAQEKTGMDCAKFVVDYCMEYKRKLPLYNIQSANPVGKENIDSLLKQFKEFQKNGN